MVAQDISGVAQAIYSLDGERFQRYSTPFVAPTGALIWLLADDTAGNRTLRSLTVEALPATS